MSKYITLTKTLFRNSLSPVEGNKKSRYKNLLLVLVIILSFIPLEIGTAKIISDLYTGLATIGQQGLVLGLGLSGVTAAIFFFGVFYVINVFYFSKDIDNLLPLPLRPSEILGTKFTLALFYEYITEILFLLPVLIVYGIKSGGGAFFYIFSAVIFLTLPIVPLVISSIISMIVMRFTNISKNKDKFRIYSGVFILILVLGLNSYLQRLSSDHVDPNTINNLLQQGNNSLLFSALKLFPTTKLAAFSLLNSTTLQGALDLAIYIAVSFAFLVIFIILGEKLYLRGVIGVSESASKRQKLSSEDLVKSTSKGSAVMAYARKELRLLFRTPIYFINCILINFLLPAFLILPLIIRPESSNQVEKLFDMIRNSGNRGTVLSIFFASSIILAAMNGIAGSAISRDGQNFYINKYLPVNYKKQILGKVLPAAVMGLVGSIITLATAAFIVKLPILIVILSAVLFIPAVFICSFTGIYLDLNFPKLIWDNEQKAVKQNINVIINMLAAFGLAALTVLAALKLTLNIWAAFFGILVVSILINYLLYKLLSTKGVNLFKNIEA